LNAEPAETAERNAKDFSASSAISALIVVFVTGFEVPLLLLKGRIAG